MVKAKKIIYAVKFDGEPKLSDFKLEEEELPPLKEGEILCKAEYLSVDPYMRRYLSKLPIGATVMGGQIAKIVESKNKDFPKDAYMFGQFGWRSYTIFDPKNVTPPSIYAYLLPDFGKLSPSLGIGCLGMPGNTAYFGFLDICHPKAGETVVISGAAGAVGSLVGQIAKLKGCEVIGLTGNADKCKWLKDDLGFDSVINHKSEDIYRALKFAAYKGVDCYFDNVGGEISSIIINQMNDFGRISVCGSISSDNLNSKEIPKVPILQPTFISKQLNMQGFLVSSYGHRWFEGINQMQKWIEEGKIKYHETETVGFDKMPEAFIDMLRGKNIGKAVIKADL